MKTQIIVKNQIINAMKVEKESMSLTDLVKYADYEESRFSIRD